MKAPTRRLWDSFNQHPRRPPPLVHCRRRRLRHLHRPLPRGYVDITPSFVLETVTYLDVDRRAPQLFADTAGVDELNAGHRDDGEPADWNFLQLTTPPGSPCPSSTTTH